VNRSTKTLLYLSLLFYSLFLFPRPTPAKYWPLVRKNQKNQGQTDLPIMVGTENLFLLWELSNEKLFMGTPLIEDFDGDGKGEIVIVTRKQTILLIDNSGIPIWETSIKGKLGDDRYQSQDASPAIADIDLDGRKEILVINADGDLICLDSQGEIKWWFKYRSNDRLQGCIPQLYWGSPKTADLTSHPGLEIVYTTAGSTEEAPLGFHFFLLSSSGNLLNNFSRTSFDLIRNEEFKGAPLIDDIDADDRPEIVLSTGGWFGEERDGQIFIFNHNGNLEKKLPEISLAFSSPVALDEGSSGEFMGFNINGRTVDLINHRGQIINSSPKIPSNIDGILSNCHFSSPAVDDIDGDGKWEVVLAAEDDKLYVFQDDLSIFWQTPFKNEDYPGLTFGSPIIVDFENDGKKEIFLGTTDGEILGFNWQGQQVFSFDAGNLITASLSAGDITGDEQPEIIVNGRDKLIVLSTDHYYQSEIIKELLMDWGEESRWDLNSDGIINGVDFAILTSN